VGIDGNAREQPAALSAGGGVSGDPPPPGTSGPPRPHGPVVIPLVLAVTAITAACFFLNAVFAFGMGHRGRRWFAISLSIIIAVMMVCYVAVPARLIGMKTAHSKRDKLTLTAVGGAISAVVCTPPYALGRIGLLMLGSRALFIPGIIVKALGLTLEAGATGAVKAVKMSAKLLPGRQQTPGDQALPGDAYHREAG